MSSYRHIRAKTRRRAHDEAALPVMQDGERQAAPSLAQSIQLLRKPGTEQAVREAAGTVQRQLGNARLMRMLQERGQGAAGTMQRKEDQEATEDNSDKAEQVDSLAMKQDAQAQPPTVAGEIKVNQPAMNSYEVRGATLAEVAENLSAEGEIARTTWDPTWNLKTNAHGIVTHLDGNLAPVVILPQLTTAGMLSDAAQTEWKRYHTALYQHTQQHLALIRKHLQGLAEAVEGKTEAEATTIIEATLRNLQAAKDAYDQATDYGRKDRSALNSRID